MELSVAAVRGGAAGALVELAAGATGDGGVPESMEFLLADGPGAGAAASGATVIPEGLFVTSDDARSPGGVSGGGLGKVDICPWQRAVNTVQIPAMQITRISLIFCLVRIGSGGRPFLGFDRS
jgi:hypothetical protein